MWNKIVSKFIKITYSTNQKLLVPLKIRALFIKLMFVFSLFNYGWPRTHHFPLFQPHAKRKWSHVRAKLHLRDYNLKWQNLLITCYLIWMCVAIRRWMSVDLSNQILSLFYGSVNRPTGIYLSNFVFVFVMSYEWPCLTISRLAVQLVASLVSVPILHIESHTLSTEKSTESSTPRSCECMVQVSNCALRAS